MSEVKFNFLNWNPDLEDFDNPGLITADNIYHDSEGWKQVGVQTSGAFNTVASSSVGAHAVPFGNAGQLIWASLSTGSSTLTRQLDIHYQAATAGQQFVMTTVTSSTLASFPGEVSAFSITDTGSSIFVNAEAEFDTFTGTPEIVNVTATFVYS